MNKDQALTALSALGHETRLDAFRLLAGHVPDGLSAGEIASRLGVLQNTLSTHLAGLARAGLVVARRQGRTIHYIVDATTVRDLLAFLMEDCCRGNPNICAPFFNVTSDIRKGSQEP